MTSQPVEQRVVVREWNYTETHLPVRRVDEHNACVTALRAALAREAALRQETWTAEQQRDREELAKDAALADAARLREALRERAIEDRLIGGFRWVECAQCNGSWQHGVTERHAPGCLAALGQEESK